MNNRLKNILKRLKSFLFFYKNGKPKFLSCLFYMDSHAKYIHNLVSSNIKKNSIILDVGAKSFRYTKYQKAEYIIGSDLISESLGYLGWAEDIVKKLSEKGNIFPTVSNCEELPIRSNSIDFITCIEVIEHVREDESAISEFSRVLKSNGKIILTTPNGDEVPNTNPYHLRHYKVNELSTLFEKYFKKVNTSFVFPNPKLYIKQYINKGLKKLLLYWYYELYNRVRLQKNSGGYTLALIAEDPKINPEQDITRVADVMNIIRCPKCKNDLVAKKNKLTCVQCKNQYKIKDAVPYLLNKNPHHQKGNGIPEIQK